MPSNINGHLRYKYFRRPIVPYLQTVAPDVLLSREHESSMADMDEAEEMPEPASKTVGTQSVFRESEAQTDPYSPDYAVRPGSAPELLTLVSLTHGAGLPAGLAEVEMIERARSKRAFEASLPPIDANDPASFERRRALMAERELKEWAEREREIEAIEAARLELIKRALQQRDADNERKNFARLEHARQIRRAEKDHFLKSVHARRLRVLRKLTAKRANAARRVNKGGDAKRDCVADYASFGSSIYAQPARHGSTMDSAVTARKYDAAPELLQTLEGLMELQASLPSSLTTTVVVKPPRRGGSSARGGLMSGHSTSSRKKAQLGKHLDFMNAAMQKRKDMAATGATAASLNTSKLMERYAVVKPVERPPTPDPWGGAAAPDPEVESREAGALLLQRLLRGRAQQNQLYAAKERRAELIAELRLGEVMDTLEAQGEVEAATKVREETVATAMEAVQGEAVGATLQYLCAELTRLKQSKKCAALSMLAERTRRMREAEEAGRREGELQAREAADEEFRRVMRVRAGTVERYLSEVIDGALGAAAEDSATEEALVKAEKVNHVVDKLEERYNHPEDIVTDLVSSFLLPEVDRQLLREEVAVDQARISLAVRDALENATGDVENGVAGLDKYGR